MVRFLARSLKAKYFSDKGGGEVKENQENDWRAQHDLELGTVSRLPD